MQLLRRIILVLFTACSLNHATRALSAITWHHPKSCSCTSIFHSDICLFASSDDDRIEVKVDQKNTFQNYESNSYDSGLQVLKAFFNIHGHLVIPRSYEVPFSKGRCVPLSKHDIMLILVSIIIDLNHQLFETDFPEEWHGAKLARHIYSMQWWQKHIASNSTRVAQLNEIDFIWGRLQPQWNIFMEAMSHYYRLHGDAKVPVSFAIPSGEKERSSRSCSFGCLLSYLQTPFSSDVKETLGQKNAGDSLLVMLHIE